MRFACAKSVISGPQAAEDAPVFMARAAGRVNLMDMHIERRGGFINPFAGSGILDIVSKR